MDYFPSIGTSVAISDDWEKRIQIITAPVRSGLFKRQNVSRFEFKRTLITVKEKENTEKFKIRILKIADFSN